MEGGLPTAAAGATGTVFLSYASQDGAAVARICQSLQAAGIAVWFDQSELRGGDVWDQKIRRQIRDCALFIPVISANTAARREGYFRLEWDLADQRSRMMARDRAFIVPVCLDATPAAGPDTPESFHRVQWERLPEGVAPPAFSARIVSLLFPKPGGATDAAQIQAGARLSSQNSSNKTIRPFRVSRAAQVAAVLAVLTLTYWAVSKLRSTQTAEQQVVAQHDVVPASVTAAPTELPTVATDKSIAVLPFLDLSEKRDQEYFSDGLTEELIDQLAHAPTLKVIARTSSFYFKGKSATIAEIAKTLTVSHVLEGSVRKSGNALRISAQLIRTSDGVHVWSQTYDRNIVDLFKLQTELAETVAWGMAIALESGGENSIVSKSALEAYNLRLEADFVGQRQSKPDTQKAIRIYLDALAIEPQDARAWASLGSAYIRLLGFGMVGSESSAKIFDHARDALNNALRVNPSLGAAYELKGGIAMIQNYDWQQADEAFRRSGELDPSLFAEARRATIWLAHGKVSEAIEAYRRALSRDPISPRVLWRLGWAYLEAERFGDAEVTFRHISELVPTYAGAKALEAASLLLQGKKAEALVTVASEPEEAWKISISPIVYWDLGSRGESDTALRELEEKFAASSAYNIAELRAYRGEVDAAFRWLERAYQQRDTGMLVMKLDPLLRNLRDDARFHAILRKLKLDGEGPNIAATKITR